MKKSFILEQCRRLDVIHAQESEEAKLSNDKCEKDLVIHNEGHKEVINDFKILLNETESGITITHLEKKALKKWLRKVIKQSRNNIEQLDKKYNFFNNCENMSEEDEISYHFNLGMDCMAYTLIEILNKGLYINKLK